MEIVQTKTSYFYDEVFEVECVKLTTDGWLHVAGKAGQDHHRNHLRVFHYKDDLGWFWLCKQSNYLKDNDYDISCVSISPGGTRIAAGFDFTEFVCVWDIGSKHLFRKIDFEAGNRMVFCNEECLAIDTDMGIYVWDLKNTILLHTFDPDFLCHVDSPMSLYIEQEGALVHFDMNSKKSRAYGTKWSAEFYNNNVNVISNNGKVMHSRLSQKSSKCIRTT